MKIVTSFVVLDQCGDLLSMLDSKEREPPSPDARTVVLKKPTKQEELDKLVKHLQEADFEVIFEDSLIEGEEETSQQAQLGQTNRNCDESANDEKDQCSHERKRTIEESASSNGGDESSVTSSSS